MTTYKFTINEIEGKTEYVAGDTVEVAASTPSFAAFMAAYEVGLGSCRVNYCKNGSAVVKGGKGTASFSYKVVY